MPGFLQYFCMPVVSLLIFLFVWFQLRNADPIIQRQRLLIITPFLIGLAIGGSLGDVSFLLIGFVFSGILAAWFMYFRFPASYRTARKQFQARQFDNAQQSLNQAIQEKPELWEAFQLRALVNLALGYFTNAEKDAHQVISMNPKAAINYNTLGNVYSGQADFERARHAFLGAYRRAPRAPLYQYNLGMTYYKLALYEDANNLLRQASKSKNLSRKIPPEVCLFLYYYLAKSEELLGNDNKAHKAYKKMKKLQKNFDTLKEQLSDVQPALRRSMEKEVEDIERILRG